MPTKEDLKKIKELKDLTEERLVDPANLTNVAKKCYRTATETADQTGDPPKEVFWKCMKDNLESEEPPNEKKRKYFP